MSELRAWRWIVSPEFESVRADKAILSAIEKGEGAWNPSGPAPELSRSRIQKLIDEECILHNSNPLSANNKLKSGDEIELKFLPPKPLDQVEAQDIPIEVLWQDEHLVVLNKPQGLTVHPSSTQAESTLVNALLFHIKDLSGVGGVLRPGIVHRLDKDTSGVMVVTKTDEAHQRLAKVFAAHDLDRRYWALCYGTLEQDELRLETKIGRHTKDRKKMSTQAKEGRVAVTEFRVLEAYGVSNKKPFASWVEARLHTGRTHQVRVHLDSLHHSILGDPTYGKPSSSQDSKWLALPKEIRELVDTLPGQALHARRLAFEHPITGKAMSFESEPPSPFQALLKEMKRYS